MFRRQRQESRPSALAWFVKAEELYELIDAASDTFMRELDNMQAQVASGYTGHSVEWEYHAVFAQSAVFINASQAMFHEWNERWKPTALAGQESGRYIYHSHTFMRYITGLRLAYAGALVLFSARHHDEPEMMVQLGGAGLSDGTEHMTIAMGLYRRVHDEATLVDSQEAIRAAMAGAQVLAESESYLLRLVLELDAVGMQEHPVEPFTS